MSGRNSPILLVTRSTSLLPRLEVTAETRHSITFVGSAGADGCERVEWSRLHEDARAMAAALQARGIGPGSHVALLGATTRPFVTAVQATWLAGATVVVLPLPMRLASIEDFVAQTRRLIVHADAQIVVIDAQLSEFLDPEPGDPPIVQLEELRAAPGSYKRPADDPDALAILQFTSGATADPKGVMVPHRCMTANLDAAVEAAALDPDMDRAVSWLPLYHDMGLIGLLGAPMLHGFELVLAAPQDFLAAPARWMEWIAEFGGPADRVAAARCESATRLPGRRCRTAKSAKSSCAAARSRPAITTIPTRRQHPAAATGSVQETSDTWSTASWSCAVGSRTSSSSVGATCFPRTSSARPSRSRACGPGTSSRSAPRADGDARPWSSSPRPSTTRSRRSAPRWRLAS